MLFVRAAFLDLLKAEYLTAKDIYYMMYHTQSFISSTFYDYEFIWMNERNDTLYAGMYYTEDNDNYPQFVYSIGGVNFTGN